MDNHFFTQAGRKAGRQQGFALVVTLTLMALLMVISLALLALAGISQRGAMVEEDQAKARANAKFALIEAIGALQKEMGPDQRVNAPASQRTSPEPVDGRRHWIGSYEAWDSFTEPNRPDPDYAFRRWLVSGDDGTISNLEAVSVEPSSDEMVLFDHPGPGGEEQVSVPLVRVHDVDTGSSGAYAWWVGDENAKALVKRAPEAAELAGAWTRGQSPPTTGFALTEEFTGLDPREASLDRLVSTATFDLANREGSAISAFHDFTTFSRGVLSDTQRGGLKRDLSLLLDVPFDDPLTADMRPPGRLYDNGITFEELWLYHNLWQALEPPVPGLESKTGGDLDGARMLITAPGSGTESIDNFRADPFSLYKNTVFLRMQWLMSIWAEENPGSEPDEEKTYRLYWITDTITTLWNPFDVPVAIHPDGYYSLKYWAVPYDLILYDEEGQIARNRFDQAAPGGNHIYSKIFSTPSAPYWGTRGTPDPVALMPGEVLLMSEGRPELDPGQRPPRYSRDQADRTIAAAAGWNHGAGRSSAVISGAEEVPESARLHYEVRPNNQTAFGDNLINLGIYYGADDRGGVPPGSHRIWMVGKRITPTSGSSARAHPDIFPTLQGDLGDLPTMTGSGRWPMMLFSFQGKTEESATAWSRFSQPGLPQVRWTELTARERAISRDEVEVTPLSGPIDSNLPQSPVGQPNRGLYGGSYVDLARGNDIVITRSVPREPPLSLGAFQNAIANGFTTRFGSNLALNPAQPPSPPEMPHAIGNSYALPVLAPDRARDGGDTDHSYHANLALWDSWFLSGIVQQRSPHHSTQRSAYQVFSEFAESGGLVPLPAANMAARIADPEQAIDRLFTSDERAAEDAHDHSAAFLMIDGAFNVQSTSVEAWRAVLASMNEAIVPVVETPESPANIAAVASGGIPVNSMLTAHGVGGHNSAAFDAGSLVDASDPRQWRGYRELDEGEIDELATAIVEEIKKRGPFLSMGDFVNRRLSQDTELALSGALQAALDRTVNATLLENRTATIPDGVNWQFPAAGQGPKTIFGAPLVNQADLLTALGPQLTARSDTFRIRTYGEHRNAAGEVTGRAWCEAIVQRIPEYVDGNDPPNALLEARGDHSAPAINSQANRDFGRRFEIVSFRWLLPGETTN